VERLIEVQNPVPVADERPLARDAAAASLKSGSFTSESGSVVPGSADVRAFGLKRALSLKFDVSLGPMSGRSRGTLLPLR
jgi:hypothetical protein